MFPFTCAKSFWPWTQGATIVIGSWNCTEVNQMYPRPKCMNFIMKSIFIMGQPHVSISTFVQFFAKNGVNLKGHHDGWEFLTSDTRGESTFKWPGDWAFLKWMLSEIKNQWASIDWNDHKYKMDSNLVAPCPCFKPLLNWSTIKLLWLKYTKCY